LRLNRISEADIQKQIRLSFNILFARDPDAQEIELSKEMIQDQGLVQYCRALLNASEFLFLF
ncbi:MAG: hypothetical protein ACKO8U_14170, partial [Pirellula sp.]